MIILIKILTIFAIVFLSSSCKPPITIECETRRGGVDIILPDTVEQGELFEVQAVYITAPPSGTNNITYEIKDSSVYFYSTICTENDPESMYPTVVWYDTISTEIQFPNKGIYYLYIKGNDEYQKTVVVE